MQIKGFIINIVSSYAHIILSVLLNIMYIPLALHYMGAERYGVWVVLITLINYLTLANFGVPTAVTNLMALSDNNDEKADLLMRGFKILSLICIVVLAISLTIYFVMSYFTSWLNSLSTEIRTSSIILIVFFILRIPFQIATAAFTANKKIFIGKIYDLLTIVFTFVSLLICIYFKQDLVFLAILSGIVLLILNVLGFINALKIVEFKNYTSPLIPIQNRDIYKPGIALFAAGMGSLIIWNTDNIVVSKYLGFQEVAVYSTAFRLFSFGYMSFNLIYGVLIPFYGQYFKSKSWDKLQSLFNFNLVIIPFIAICVWLVGWLFSKDIIVLWLGNDKLYAGSKLYFLLGAYGLVLGYVGVMFNLLTSLNQLKSLFYITISEAVINLGMSIFLVQFYGIEGVAMGTLLASIIVPLLILPYLIHKNENLKLDFHFKKFFGSLTCYVILLLGLFLIKANEFGFILKLSLAIMYLSFFLGFQYFWNKRLVNTVVQILKAKNG